MSASPLSPAAVPPKPPGLAAPKPSPRRDLFGHQTRRQYGHMSSAKITEAGAAAAVPDADHETAVEEYERRVEKAERAAKQYKEMFLAEVTAREEAQRELETLQARTEEAEAQRVEAERKAAALEEAYTRVKAARPRFDFPSTPWGQDEEEPAETEGVALQDITAAIANSGRDQLEKMALRLQAETVRLTEEAAYMKEARDSYAEKAEELERNALLQPTLEPASLRQLKALKDSGRQARAKADFYKTHMEDAERRAAEWMHENTRLKAQLAERKTQVAEHAAAIYRLTTQLLGLDYADS